MARPDGIQAEAEASSEALRPGDRIRRRSEYRSVQQKGRRVHTPHFILIVLPRPEGCRRLGITVTKKVSSSAVSRNRVKRLVREVFRRNRDRFPEGCDVVFIAKRGAPTLDYHRVLLEVDGASRALLAAARGARPVPGA